MTLFTVPVKHYPLDQLNDLPESFQTEPWYALRLTFRDGSASWILSHREAEAHLPPGSSVLKTQIQTLPDISRNCGLLTNIAEISEFSYSVVDDERELANLIAQKSLVNQGTLGILVEDYEWDSDTDWSQDHVIATSHLENDSAGPDGTLLLSCTDVRRNTDVDIWIEKSYRLKASITAGEMKIPTTLTNETVVGFQNDFFAHGSHYDADPGEPSIAYAKINESGEIYSFTHREYRASDDTWLDVVKDRGALGTASLVSAVIIGDDTDEKNRPSIKLVPHLQGEVTELVYALMTGETYTGETLPASWHGSVLKGQINLPSFSRGATGFQLSFTDEKKTNLKKFIEQQCLLPKTAVLNVDRAGKLEWLTIEKPRRNAPATIDFNADSIIGRPSKFNRSLDKIRNPLTANIGWSHVTRSYRAPIIYDNQVAMAKNPVAKGVDISLRGVQAGIHTDEQMFKLLGVLGDEYFWETGGISLKASVTERGHDLGQVARVRVNMSDTMSETGVAEDINRSFVIVGSTYHRRDRSTTYQLSCATDRQTTIFEGDAQHNAPLSEYMRDGIDITTVPGVINNNGVLSGSPTLSMQQKYYYYNAASPGVGVEHAPDWTPNYTGFGPYFEYWVFGPWINKSPTGFDFTGLGLHPGGAGGVDEAQPRPEQGEVGYFGTSVAGGSTKRDRYYRDMSLSDDNYDFQPFGNDITSVAPLKQTPGIVRSVPEIPLANNNGRIEGFPPDLSGSGGTGVAAHVSDDTRYQPNSGGLIATIPIRTLLPGASGQRGGAGFKLISWGGGNVGNGKVITDGAPSPAAVRAPADWGQPWLSRPGPAQPGAWIWAIDGNHLLPSTVDGNTFLARNGDSTMPGRRLPARQSRLPEGNTEDVHVWHEPQPYENYWIDAFRLVRIPANGRLQKQPVGGLAQELAKFNNQSRLLFQINGANPSQYNLGDYSIDQALANGSDLEPEMYFASSSGWILVDWDIGDIMAETHLANWRVHKKTTITGGYDRPENQLGQYWVDYNTGIGYILGSVAAADIPVNYSHDVGEWNNPDVHMEKYSIGIESWTVDTDRNRMPVKSLSGGAGGVVSQYTLEVTPNPVVLGDIAGTAGPGYIGRPVTVQFVGNGGNVNKSTLVQPDGTWAIPYDPANDLADGASLIAQVNDGDGGHSNVDAFIYRIPSLDYSLTVNPDPTLAGVISGTAGLGYVGESVFIDFRNHGGEVDKMAPIQPDGTWSVGYDPANDGADGNTWSAYVDADNGNSDTDLFTYNISGVAPKTYFIDVDPDPIENGIVSGTAGTGYIGQSVTVKFTAVGVGGVRNETAIVQPDGTWSVAYNLINDSAAGKTVEAVVNEAGQGNYAGTLCQLSDLEGISNPIRDRNGGGTYTLEYKDLRTAGQNTPTGGATASSGGQATVDLENWDTVVLRHCVVEGRWDTVSDLGDIYDYGYFGFRLRKNTTIILEECTAKGYFDGFFIDDVEHLTMERNIARDNLHSQAFLRRLDPAAVGAIVVRNNLFWQPNTIIQDFGSMDCVNFNEAVLRAGKPIIFEDNFIWGGKGNNGSGAIVDSKYKSGQGRIFGGVHMRRNITVDTVNVGQAITADSDCEIREGIAYQRISWPVQTARGPVQPPGGSVGFACFDSEGGAPANPHFDGHELELNDSEWEHVSGDDQNFYGDPSSAFTLSGNTFSGNGLTAPTTRRTYAEVIALGMAKVTGVCTYITDGDVTSGNTHSTTFVYQIPSNPGPGTHFLTVDPNPTQNGVISGTAGPGYVGENVYIDFLNHGGSVNKLGLVQSDGTWSIPYDPANDAADGNTWNAYVDADDGTFHLAQFTYRI